jgi:hypothetical protein
MFWLGLLIRYGLPIALKWGWVNGGEAEMVRLWYDAKKLAASIKTYPTYPAPPPGENLAPGTTNTNMVTGESLEPKP